MSSTLSLNSLIPKLDLEQEKVRWNQINKVLTESKPDIVHAPREIIWKKNKST